MTNSRPLLILEFALLCVVFPGIIIFGKLGYYMFSFLWAAAFYCLFIFWKNGGTEGIKALWKWDAVTWEALRPILIRWVLASIGLIGLCLIIAPERFFILPLERPLLVLALLFVYPVLSALPQEFIFCSFFFKRYEALFGRGLLMILASAIVFAYAHMLYINWVAPTLSFLAGLIFAKTYAETKSLALVTIEHGLYGNALFVIGLGYYFFSGDIGP